MGGRLTGGPPVRGATADAGLRASVRSAHQARLVAGSATLWMRRCPRRGRAAHRAPPKRRCMRRCADGSSSTALWAGGRCAAGNGTPANGWTTPPRASRAWRRAVCEPAAWPGPLPPIAGRESSAPACPSEPPPFVDTAKTLHWVSERAQQIGGMAMSAMQIVGGVEMPVAGTRSTDVTSVESGSTNRDDGLRSASWFDVDNHPTAQFRSTAITVDDNGGTSPATSPSWESRARWSSTTSSTSATPRSVGHRPRRVQHTRQDQP
jgi:hypothetical protein